MGTVPIASPKLFKENPRVKPSYHGHEIHDIFISKILKMRRIRKVLEQTPAPPRPGLPFTEQQPTTIYASAASDDAIVEDQLLENLSANEGRSSQARTVLLGPSSW